MSTFSNTAREVELPNGDIVKLHNGVTENSTSNIKKFKYDDNGHVTESTAADAEDLNLSGYSTPTTGTTDIGTSDDVQTAIGKLDHQSQIDQTNILLVQGATAKLVDKGAKNKLDEWNEILKTHTPSGNKVIVNGITYTYANGSITMSGTATENSYLFIITNTMMFSSDTPIVVAWRQKDVSNATITVQYVDDSPIISTDDVIIVPSGKIGISTLFLTVPTGTTVSGSIDLMICTKAEYDVSPNYEPYALPNYELTKLESEDRSNILYALQTGVKNIIKLTAGTYKDNVATFTVTNDGEVLVSSTSSSTSAVTVNTMELPAGDYVYWYDNTSSSGACDVRLMNGSTLLSGEFTLSSTTTISIAIFSYATNSNVSIKPMLCTAGAWAQEPNVYRKPALPNADLTQLEQQDRNALVEVVDKGAKNKLKLDKDAIKSLNSGGTWSGYVYTPTTAPNLTVTINDDGTVTLNGSTSSSLVTVALERKASSGFQGYVLSGSKTNTKLVYQLAVSPYTVYATVDGTDSAVIANYTDESTIQLSLQVVANSTFSNTVITPMICSQADWKISQNFAPFALPNSDLTYLEAEDRAALVEVVDSGAKNEFEFGNFTPGGERVSATISDYSVTVTGASAWAKAWRTFRVTKSTAYALSFRVTNVATVANPQYRVSLGNNHHSGGSYYGIIACNTTGNYDMIFTPPADTDIYLVINPNYTSTAASDTPSITVDNIMICTKAAFDISPAFVPHKQDPFYQIPINHNMIYRGKNLGDTLTDAQHTALSGGNFTDLYLGDYWTKSVTIPAFYEVTTAEPENWSTNYTSYYTKSGDTYTPVSGDTAPTWAANTYYERLVPEQTVTLKAVIADFDTFYAGYASSFASINTHHAAVIVHGFNNVVWNKTNTTAGGYVNSLIHKWLVNSALPQIETWFGSAKVLSHQKSLTNAITGDAASGRAWSSQKISLLSENQVYGSKVVGNSKAANGGYEPGEAFKHLNVFNHIDANLLFGNKNSWLRDIASDREAAVLGSFGDAASSDTSATWSAPDALILLS